jgi:non-lysosomal glucosylceramidase
MHAPKQFSDPRNDKPVRLETDTLTSIKGKGQSPASFTAPFMDRRSFMERMGTTMAALAAVRFVPAVAGPFTADDVRDHHVPADKRLSAAWVRALTARGERTWYSGEDLKTIGMPVGGIGAGQVYLSGDGRLIYWDIFNRNHNTGYGAINYKSGRLPSEVATPTGQFEQALDVFQGFAIRIEDDSQSWLRRLDQRHFPAVRFCGEYPIGTVDYQETGAPVAVTLEAFSPFVPLDTHASTLPATMLRYTVRNVTERVLRGAMGGWLENKVCPYSARWYAADLTRINQPFRTAGANGVLCSVRAKPPVERSEARAPHVFADFEKEGYGEWMAEGEAFGSGPARGTLQNQQTVSGFKGRGLINTFVGGDDRAQGRLLSPEFTIDRGWISFLVGGGSHAGRTCMNLLVDGKVVRTAAGRDRELLEIENWSVEEFRGRSARLEILDRESGGWGHVNIDHIEFRDEPAGKSLEDLPGMPDYGTMALAFLGSDASGAHLDLVTRDLPDSLFAAPAGRLEAVAAPAVTLCGGVTVPFELAPGESRVFTFAVTWHFPNMYREHQRVGNAYAQRFGDAGAVIVHLARQGTALANATRLWHETYYDSTLPWWLLDRVHSTVANLATTTAQWWENGRFWGWEGCGCCHGTCGHVWNYEHAMARLFPELERSVRELQDFAPGAGFNPQSGAIGFRGDNDFWAGDSQGGYILKAYREHCCSANASFLRRNWAQIRKALEFLMAQDGDGDGLIEGRQHQTYDQDYYGANTFVGSLYLGALRAGESMALELDDLEFAGRCRTIFESGQRRSMDRLFNGEYFVQTVDLEKHPDWQYAEGCLADQLFGQGWAHQVGLGYLYPEDAVRRALASIWKYCWAPDVKSQNDAHQPERWFAYPGEAGLFTCTWPRSRHLGPKSTRYRDEIWTGIEYQVANHMAWEGLITEALAICRAVHERYHPSKRNPWNEIECGDHYARAMASWGVLISLAGYEYHGPSGVIGFAPRLMPEDFRCAFTAAEGWGTFSQKRTGAKQTGELEIKWGRLQLKELRLTLPANAKLSEARATSASQPFAFRAVQQGEIVRITLEKAVILVAGQSLQVHLGT